jgi:transposase
MAAENFIGIDVARDSLEVAVRPTGEHWSVGNHTVGMADLLVRVSALRPTLIVLEATGGLELPVLGVVGSAGLPVVAVNPRQVRDFAKATGKLAKTDALDAQVLAHFADAVRPAVRPLPDAATQALSALVARRRQLVEMLTLRKKIAGRVPRRPFVPTSRSTLVGCANGSKVSTRSCARHCGPARSGASRRTCSAACRALGRWSR